MSENKRVNRVLVVDDDPVMRLLMRETLEAEDITVGEAEDGLSALTVFEQFHPHLVLLDVRMPIMDGFAVCAEIRKHLEGENVTIVMVTGLDDYSSIEQAYQVGATDFITKPIIWPVFNHRMRYLLRAREVFVALQHSETQLQRKEKQLREAQKIGRMGHWSWDVVSGDLIWSDEIFRIFGHVPGSFETTYEHFIKMVHPQDVSLVEQSVKNTFTPGGRYSIDHRIILPDREIRWVHEEAVGRFDDNGELLNVQGTVQDITERKQIDEALRRSEKELRGILDNMVDIFYRTDVDGRFVMLSQSVEEQTGWAVNDLIGKEIADFYVDPHSREKFLEVLSEFGGKVIGYETLLRHRDNSEIWFATTARYFYDDNGEIAGVEGTVRNITDKKNTEEKLRLHSEHLQELVEEQVADIKAAKEEAERANHTKSEFLANMSHELRTPMHAILSFAELGERKSDGAGLEKLLHYFIRIRQSGLRLLTLLNELLDLSKLESGRMEFDLRQNDLQKVVQTVSQEINELLNEKSLELSVSSSSVNTVAWFDKDKLLQVMRNLLSNAIKFTPEGGTIRIVYDKANLPADHHQADEGTVPAISLTVTDQGMGIPEDELETVFDKFVQSSKTRNGAGGTGLGLAICREIIERHGGTIRACNNDSGGAAFTFLIPRHSPESK